MNSLCITEFRQFDRDMLVWRDLHGLRLDSFAFVCCMCSVEARTLNRTHRIEPNFSCDYKSCWIKDENGKFHRNGRNSARGFTP